MRSGFLRGVLNDITMCKGESQSLLNEVWFPTLQTGWWLYSKIVESQSLLNEVWFPTRFWETLSPLKTLSQSLLNEVWFPTTKRSAKRLKFLLSQSLLNEVWFPTHLNLISLGILHMVAIPSKWGLVSYALHYHIIVNGNMSQSLLNEVWFPTTFPRQRTLSSHWQSQSLLNEVWFPTGGILCYQKQQIMRRNPF